MANALQFSNIVLSHNPFALGDPLTMSFKAKNVLGSKITEVNYFRLQYGAEEYGSIIIGYLDYPETAVSWSNGKTRTFSDIAWNPNQWARSNITQIFSDPTVRAVRVALDSAVQYGSYGAGDYVLLNAYLMNKRYAPIINGFSVARWAQTNPDESDKVRVTLDIDTVDSTYFSDMTVRLYYSTGAVSTSSSYVDLTSQISSLVGAGEVDLDLTQTFGTGDSWNFMLVFGDSYENVTAYASVPNAFANMHLAGFSTGGVAFGKFSSSTQGNPLFECEYPAIFSDDIASPLGKLLKVVTVDGTVSVSTGSASQSKTIAVNPGTGWTPIGVVGFEASQSWCAVRQARLVNGSVEMAIRYHGSSSTGQTVTLTADVLCLRTSLT